VIDEWGPSGAHGSGLRRIPRGIAPELSVRGRLPRDVRQQSFELDRQTGVATLKLAVGERAEPGRHQIAVEATLGEETKRAVVTLVVRAPARYVIELPEIQVLAGGRATWTIRQTGGSDSATFVVTGIRAARSSQDGDPRRRGGARVSMSIPRRAGIARYPLVIQATDGEDEQRLRATVHVVPFLVEAERRSISAVAGRAVELTVKVSRYGQEVTLTVSGLPDGARPVFAPTRLRGGRSTLTIRIPREARRPRPYQLRITGRGREGSAWANVELKVR